MRRLGVVTGGRADYGILRPVLRRARKQSDLSVEVFVTGMHLCERFGSTVAMIEDDGFDIAARVEMLEEGDTPLAIGRSMGAGTAGFASAFARHKPDLLLVVGDRFETHAAAAAAVPFNIPLAHLHGGELSEGVIDDALRHSLTKLSHLHFVATTEYARRVIQLGEEPWRVVVSGAPSLDRLEEMTVPSRQELTNRHGISFTPAPLLVTLHPVTLAVADTGFHVRELMAALEASGRSVVFTQPNADSGGSLIADAITAYVVKHATSRLVDNLGTDDYFGLMSEAAAMVGNSSSGVVEAPSFRLPVVNIGDRQDGRVKAANVIDVGYSRDAILAGIRRAVDPAFRQSLKGLVNPYWSRNASEIIVHRLSQVPLDRRLTTKRFYDLAFDSVTPSTEPGVRVEAISRG